MRYLFIILAVFMSFNLQAQRKRIEMDPSVRKGVLPNGMTYYIRHNEQTKGVAEFFIAQKVGSILEEPRQRGLAHFLEHMAFNGTRNFPGDSLKPGIVKWCESVGIKFGTNLNAYTSVDQTVYNISAAPVKREGVIDSCLLILHDWSHNLLLSDEEIDKERGVIEEEWRSRSSAMAMQRLMEQATPVIYAGTKYADAMPIGNMDIVRNFPYQDLRDYYHKWYRPDLQAIIVVGDIDMDKMEAKIKKLFSAIPMPANPAKRIYYPVNDNEKMIIHTATDKEQPTVNFTLYMKRETTPKEDKDKLSTYADDYKTTIIRMAINDRLDALQRKADAPFISGSVRDGSFFLASTKDAFTMSAILKEGKMLDGMKTLAGEIERARVHGLTQQELERGKAEMLSFAQNAYNDRENRSNRSLVSDCVNNFLQEEPIISPARELEIVKQLSKTVTLADVNRLAKEIITNKNQVVTLYGPDKKNFKLPAHDAIETVILTAQKQQYKPFVDEQLPDRLIARLPKPGKIVSEQPYKYGYTEFKLSNGMHVYVRPTDFKADEVNFKLFSFGGRSLYPDHEMPNLAYLISGATIGGVGDYDDLTLEKMLAGKTASISPFVGEETEGMNGSSNVKDMRTLFELAYLYFTQPRRDDKAFEGLMERQAEFLTNYNANPRISYNDTLHKVAYRSTRFESMNREKLKLVNYDRIMEIYKERFGNAADFKLILTGNIDLDKIRPMLCQYMASLPSNDKFETVGSMNANLIDGDTVRTFSMKQSIPSNTTTIVIKGKLEYNSKNDMLLDVIGQLLRIVYTEKVREEKGGTYGVSVTGEMQHHPFDEGMLRIAFQTDPEKYDELIPIIYEQLHKMAEEGPSQEDMEKVKAYELKTYDQVLRKNNYWEYVIYTDLFNGIDVDTNYRSIVRNMTAEDVRTTLKKLLDQGNRIQVTMTQAD